MAKDMVLGVLIGLILLVGVITGVAYAVDGFTPLVTRLCMVGAILGVAGWVAADTME